MEIAFNTSTIHPHSLSCETICVALLFSNLPNDHQHDAPDRLGEADAERHRRNPYPRFTSSVELLRLLKEMLHRSQ
ncbi:hypothetical protein [Ensifer sp. 4252]|uniref:hypothetical protein n=1 Tax=Ensifer sp. 4252 TaxID=3373915 RepID=UPI003D1A723E